MHWPYTRDFLDSFMAAQIGAALMMTAVLLYWPLVRGARATLLVGVWLSVIATRVVPSLEDLGLSCGASTVRLVLLCCASLGTVAALVSRRPNVAIVALAAQVPLWLLTGFLEASDWELSALHMAWLGLIAGVLGRGAPSEAGQEPETIDEGSYRMHDAVAFVAGTTLAAIVCLTVLRRSDGSADEWGYTFQTAIFAKGHLTSEQPACWHFLESFYIFHHDGRLFSQYTPGWPMFLVPFFWVRALWLGAPVSMGLLAWGMARLGRSAMRGAWRKGDRRPSARVIRIAGTWAAVLSVLGTSLLSNAASRYTHVYVVALYAFSLEALVQVTTPGLARQKQLLWGLVLGTASVQAVAVRPADGAFAGIGVAVVFVIALVQRRVGARAFTWGAAAAGFSTLLTLVILRVQIGRWFASGYAFNTTLRPWNGIKFSWPGPHEWKYGLPLATGAYCWWPTSIPLGLAGLARMRGRAGELALAMGLSCIPYVIFCMLLDLDQRGVDWGYGPRYLMILVLPAAIGGAVALAPLTVSALQRATGDRTALRQGAPLALAVFAVVAVWLRIVPLEWATVADHTRQHAALRRAVDDAHLDNVIVLAAERTGGLFEMDIPMNLPVDLYPDQPVLLASERGEPEAALECLQSAYPGRRIVRASGRDTVTLSP